MSHVDPSKPRHWYTVVKQINGMNNKSSRVSLPGHEADAAADLANSINGYFGSICTSLPPIDTGDLPAFLSAASPQPTVNRCLVWRALSRTDSNKAPGPDGVQNKLLKVFAFELGGGTRG